MKKKGSVLIFVLALITFGLTLTLMMNEKTVTAYYEIKKVKNINQSYIYAKTAVKGFLKILKEDDIKYDSPFDDMFTVQRFSVDSGYISFDIIPLNSKININAITSKTVFDRIKNAYENLFDDNQDYQLAKLKDYIDKDNEITPNEEETELKNYYDEYIKIKNAPLDTLMETAYLFDFNFFKKFSEFFTSGESEYKLNINFASKNVLINYLPEISDYIDDLLEYRAEKPIKNISNIKEIANIPDEVYLKLLKYLTVKSSLFYLKINVNLDEEDYFYHALIKRTGKKVELLKFFKGSGQNYY